MDPKVWQDFGNCSIILPIALKNVLKSSEEQDACLLSKCQHIFRQNQKYLL